MVKNLIMDKEIESSKRSHFLKDGEISSSFYEELYLLFRFYIDVKFYCIVMVF